MRCVLAEMPLLRVRLLRTRLGVWLTLLLGAILWLERTSPVPDPFGATVLVGILGAVLCVAALAGSRADRAALACRLLDPTSPGAVAAGRWLGAMCAASLLVLAVAVEGAWRADAVLASFEAAIAGLAAAAAVTGCTLALVLTGGNGLAMVWFAWLLLLSGAPPEAILGRGHASVAAIIAAGLLEIGPSVWRYRAIASGDLGAAAHAAAWAGIGLLVAAWRVARLGGRRL